MRWFPLGLVAVALALAACSDDDPSRATPPTAGAQASGSTTTTIDRSVEHAVGRRTIEVVDRSRPTAADPNRDLDAEPDRTLPLLLLYPAAGDVTDPTTPVDDAPVADGEFPLIVFSHGWTGTGPSYEDRLQEWARAGYVVAAPTYPLTSGPGSSFTDYVNQPADVSFVIDEVTSLPDGDPLAGHVDDERIAAAGHSLGAMTTIGVALNSCCHDERIDAAIELSGRQLPFPGGDYDLSLVPILAVHGAQDRVVSVRGSDSLFADAPGPAAYLRFPEGDHTSYLFTEGPLIDEVVLAFLDAYLYDDPSDLDAVPAVVDDSSATFDVKPEG